MCKHFTFIPRTLFTSSPAHPSTTGSTEEAAEEEVEEEKEEEEKQGRDTA